MKISIFLSPARFDTALALFFLLLTVISTPCQTPEIVVQSPHTAGVRAVAFSPDGSILASGGGEGDNTIKLWNLEAQDEIRTFAGHQKSVKIVVFSSDGKFLASAADDDTIKVWNVTNGKLQKDFTENVNSVWSLAFSPDNKILASGAGDGSIKIWLLASEENTFRMFPEKHTGNVNSLSFSPLNPNLLASGSEDATIRIWDINKTTSRPPLPGTAAVKTVSFTAQGESLLSGYEDGIIRLWNLQPDSKPRILHPKSGFTWLFLFSRDGKVSLTANAENEIKMWNLEVRREIKLRPFEKNLYPLSFALSPDGNKLVIGSLDGKEGSINLRDLVSRKEVNLKKQQNSISLLALSSNDQALAVVSNDGTIWLWDFLNLTPVYPIKNSDSVNAVEFSPSGRLLAIGTMGGSVKLWNLKMQKPEIKCRMLSGIVTVAFSPDENILACGNDKGTIRIEKLNNTSQEANESFVGAHKGAVNSLVFHPRNKNLLVSSGGDNTTIIWDLEKKEKIPFKNDSTIMWVDFSFDGKILATGDLQGKIRLINLEDKNQPEEILNKNEDSTRQKMIREFPRLYGHYYGEAASKKLITQRGESIKVTLLKRDSLQEIFTLTAADENDWIVTTNDGFFDGNLNARRRILWRLNNNTFQVVPVEAFYYEYFYPGLLKKLLADEKPELPENAAPFERKDIRQHRVRLYKGKCGAVRNPAIPANSYKTNAAETDLCVKITASPNFTVQDLRQFRALANRLAATGADPFSKRLFSRFLPENQSRLRSYINSSPEKISDRELFTLKQIILQEFNSSLRNPNFYESNKDVLAKFADSREIPGLLKIKKENKGFEESSLLISILNRKLLEKIYPTELRNLEVDNSKTSNSREINSPPVITQNKNCPPGEMCIQDMRLFWNGILIKRWRGDMAKACARISSYRLQCDIKVPLTKGENAYSVYFFNQDGVKGVNAEISFTRY